MIVILYTLCHISGRNQLHCQFLRQSPLYQDCIYHLEASIFHLHASRWYGQHVLPAFWIYGYVIFHISTRAVGLVLLNSCRNLLNKVDPKTPILQPAASKDILPSFHSGTWYRIFLWKFQVHHKLYDQS